MDKSNVARVHSLRRTSKKGPGQEFIGTCVNCGKENLTWIHMSEFCKNPRRITEDEVVIEAMRGTWKQ